jgi:hypothetical protein
LSAGGLIAEALLELDQGAGKVRHRGNQAQLCSSFVLSRTHPRGYNILCPRTQRDKALRAIAPGVQNSSLSVTRLIADLIRTTTIRSFARRRWNTSMAILTLFDFGATQHGASVQSLILTMQDMSVFSTLLTRSQHATAGSSI